MDYILVFCSTLLTMLYVSVSKKYQTLEGEGMAAVLRFAAIEGVFTTVFFSAFSGFQFAFSPFSLIMAFALAFFAVGYLLVGFQIMKRENMAVYTLFLMSGGMLLPYVFGVAFLNEDISVFRVLGLIFILVAIGISNRTKSKSSVVVYMLCAAVFVLNGFVSIVSKCHQINTTHTPVDSTAFVMYTGICKFVLCTIALIFCNKGKKLYSFSCKTSFWIIPIGALMGGVAYMMQLNGAKTLPATVLYPIVTGGGIIFSAFAGKVFFGEKLTKQQIASVLLCFLGTLMFL